MKLKLFALLVVLTALLVFGGFVYAGSTVFQVTDNSYEDSLPQIKSDYVVWQGKVDGDWEVFFCSIHTPEAPIQITDDDYDDISPQTDGDYVVWQKHDTSLTNQIFLYAIDGTDPPGGTMISNDDSRDNYSQRIAAGRVVWTSQLVAHSFEPGEIMLYDAKNLSGPDSISDSTFDCSSPRINSETVVWVQSNGDGTTTLFMYDLTSENPEPQPAPEGFVWLDSPQTDGGLTVLTRHDGSDREIFVYNKYSKSYEQINDDNGIDDRYPRISGNHVAWMGDEEIFVAEYVSLGLISPVDGAVLSNTPPPIFAWEGIGYERFNIEFSKDQDFLTGNALTSSIIGPTSLSEMSFTPTEEEWEELGRMASTNGPVYWRVEGESAGADQSHSQTRSFTIEGGSGSAPIAGVAETDITGSDASDAAICFINSIANSLAY